ncbi:Glucan endo-1,3-beta-D-glucosidase [Rhodococcus sp. AW25M09]|uniref:glycoside hydrolase family 16 protein n=1 Tax=Rhodococcus sp. AW25M09 TaxID=1268303 RepID=UPI0002ACF7AF|nr:glycoside hydrolase family 16 protein [Rhodococcus sp. AW25M09]CCQ13463.1 Glucan endo-1,3-beta-D-glucosidase [Rhodococcus sp. AW25M09]
MSIGRVLSVSLLVVATTVSCAQTNHFEPALVSSERCDPMAADVMSGDAVPREDPPGWHQIFVDDFDRCDLGDNWGAYYGRPGGDPASWWDYEQASVSGGALRLRAEQKDGRWVTGGASNSPVSQKYGKWDVRLRADRSDEISYHILLWPADEVWPPEIDIAESADGTRQTMSSFLHWSGEKDEHHFSQADLQLDTNQWQTVGVEWDPEQIRYMVNGKVWARTPLGASIPEDSDVARDSGSSRGVHQARILGCGGVRPGGNSRSRLRGRRLGIGVRVGRIGVERAGHTVGIGSAGTTELT